MQNEEQHVVEASFLRDLVDIVEKHRAKRQSTQHAEQSIGTDPFHNSWLPTRGNVLFTLLIVAGLLFAQNVGVLSLFAAPNAQTASTGTIAYQGRLADADGNALTDTVNMSFRLYSAATSGAPLWEEQWTGTTSVQVSDGLFNVMLGSVAPIPQDVITGNSNLFLGITVGTDSEMSPRVQLGSVPFATQALTVPDASVTSRKVKLAHGEGLANYTPWNLPLTVDVMNIPGTQTTITLDTPQTLMVNATFDLLVDASGPTIGFLVVNGERHARTTVVNLSGRTTIGQTWILDLPAGSHTLHLAAKKGSETGAVYVARGNTLLTWLSFSQ